MLKIGLTGGIGCGKSTVTQLFSDLGTPVIDADIIAHALVSKGQSALLEISEIFGEQILLSDGSLNRSKLGETIFSDPLKKAALEQIIHPRVVAEIKRACEQIVFPYCIIAIPLLFESNMEDLVDRILVVDCPRALQVERIKTRDPQRNEVTINAIIDSQISPELRRAKANDLIDNSKPDKSLAEEVKKLHNLYLSLLNINY